MPRNGPLLRREVMHTARRAIEILEDEGFTCCLFGSTACAEYGMRNRTPKDVDLVVMNAEEQDIDPEELKYILVSADDNFYLVDSRDPNADYRVLWYRLRGHDRRCKVDILVPGLLSIPEFDETEINRTDSPQGLPLMPLLTLILLKLRGWSDHRQDDRHWMQAKVPEDEGDIAELLQIASEEYGLSVADEEHWWPDWFVDESKERMAEFVDEWPEIAEEWMALGFDFIVH
ncbi:hypothetical protein CC1G_09255 [Coprinopsis cinerea okayama7|uniref:Uncharacterized protein n=1 Tax=Coprinopsis cinerea (strain Okayama-7 / 130 / ATCC MYA-4618 / FGSC 9003) TaxID=240176 RepID=A8P553_COPC7|nr:hypothetical protein CC1G_09255 [Coprinopsis cinerea okayama7\|eukprot:XP_001838878.1 hypothetical protein CC1G_09255 [Coprinopsis cinerea okayama7\